MGWGGSIVVEIGADRAAAEQTGPADQGVSRNPLRWRPRRLIPSSCTSGASPSRWSSW